MLSSFKQLPEWQLAEIDVCPCCCVKQFPCQMHSKALNTRRNSGCDNGWYLPKWFNRKWFIGQKLKRIWVIRQMKGKARFLLKYKCLVLVPCVFLSTTENRTGQVSQNWGPAPAVSVWLFRLWKKTSARVKGKRRSVYEAKKQPASNRDGCPSCLLFNQSIVNK